MGILLDTHALLWFAEDSAKLPPSLRDLIRREPAVYVSVASIWELGIKFSLSRFGVPETGFSNFIDDCLNLCNARLLPIEVIHVRALTTLPLHHRDPFDRMLVAQAMTEGLPLVSHDQHLARYACEVIW